MQWSYVLRSRERWVSSASASDEHIERATDQLHSFGVAPGEIQDIARASHVEVRMIAFVESDDGWSMRTFPWEYVIAGATRPYRHGQPFTITRTLELDRTKAIPASRTAGRPDKDSLRVLYVESAPGELAKEFDFRSERELIDMYLMGEEKSERLVRLFSPTPSELAEAVERHRPHVVHLAGVDNHQGELVLRGLYHEERVRTTTPGRMTTPEIESSDAWQRDGYLLANTRGEPLPQSPSQLAIALTGNRKWFPWLVCMNLENSAGRVAPRVVRMGAHAAIGFQDTVDNSFAEVFFGSLYSSLRSEWDLAGAFQEAWRGVRERGGSLVGTGVVLWTDAPEIAGAKAGRSKRADRSGPPRARVRPDEVGLDWIRSRLRIKVSPTPAINYSLLHNDGELFDEFSIRPFPDSDFLGVQVRATLSAGLESAEYACSVDLKGHPIDLRRNIRVSLGANLIRSVHEAISTTWLVEVRWGDHVILRETHPVRLLPIDQWRDATHGRSWLPSFVFPRDRAVCELVSKASDYVRVLRDDPAAGFEGYQCLPASPTPRDAAEVDLQVQAIWSTILYEWRLTYINPPPSYSSDLDSQRLRTPTIIGRDRHGTCIDLALLFAACLELVDIWPVVFLLDDHAFPGYWRADAFHGRFRSARPEEGAMEEIMSADEEASSVAGAQRYPWAVGRTMVREILREIRAGRLVPLETVRLTESCGFLEAIEAGKRNFESPDRFEFLIDVAIARQHGITPLPLLGERQ